MSEENVKAQLKQRFLESCGVWGDEWEALLRMSPSYLEGYLKIRQASCRKRLSPKVREFIFLAVSSSCTHMYAPAIRAHTIAALAAGAKKQEIFEVCGLSYLLGVHTMTLGAPILFELMDELGIDRAGYEMDDQRARIKQQFVDRRGFWPETFTILLEMDPRFFQEYMEFSSFSYSESKALEPKDRELVVCALDCATTHLYGRGTKIHMRNALKLGANPDEIIEMLEITSLMGIHGVTLAASIVDQPVSHAITVPEEKVVHQIGDKNRPPSLFARILEVFTATSGGKWKPSTKTLASFGDANRHGSMF